MKKQIDCSLILPCYNESPVFLSSIHHILSILDHSRLTYEIVFVDDKSSDNTVSLIKDVCKKHPQCSYISHEKNMGRGKTVSDGIRAAKGEVVGYIDIDCEVSPFYIPEMVSMILHDQVDVVIGRRIYRTTVASIPREIFSRGYVMLTDWCLDTGGMDTETGYKFFHRKKILPLLSQATHPHWFWDTQIMIYAKRAGLRIKEVPVLYLRRFDKVSSVRLFSDIWSYLVEVWRLKSQL